jgi:hypothetical protein
VYLCLNTKNDSNMTYATQCHVAEEAPRPDLNGLVVLAGKDISSVCTVPNGTLSILAENNILKRNRR